MPPTELMKILSRADHIKKEFMEFLHNINILEYHEKHQYLNPLPYSLNDVIVKQSLLKCFGMSFCRENTSEGIYRRKINRYTIENIHLYSNDDFYIYSSSTNKMGIISVLKNKKLTILFPKEISMLQIYKDHDENISFYIIDRFWHNLEFKNVRALSIASNRIAITIAFADLVDIECPNRRVCMFYSPSKNIILFSSNETIVNLIRKYHLTQFIIESDLNLNIDTPLIEILDYTTFALPIAFNNSCIQFIIFNPLYRSTTSIIKSYRYVTKIIIDDITEYNYKHNIVRIGLAPYSNASFEICLKL